MKEHNKRVSEFVGAYRMVHDCLYPSWTKIASSNQVVEIVGAFEVLGGGMSEQD